MATNILRWCNSDEAKEIEAKPPKEEQNPGSPSGEQMQNPRKPADFDWAKQAELLRATKRVLGVEESPSKGTISRAVHDGAIHYNGKSGRQCLVNVDSFLVWITTKKDLQHDEARQVADAIISEIRSRNTDAQPVV